MDERGDPEPACDLLTGLRSTVLPAFPSPVSTAATVTAMVT